MSWNPEITVWGGAVRAGKTQATREAAREVHTMEMTAEAEAEINEACDKHRELLIALAGVYATSLSPDRFTRAIRKQDVWEAQKHITLKETV